MTAIQNRPWLGIALAALALSPTPAAVEVAVPARPALGINLAGPADWNTELPFVDVFRLSRAWISQKEGAGWGQGPPLELDENGWVRRLEPGGYAETLLCTIEGGHYPGGRWTVLWQGRGRLEMARAKVVEQTPGRMVVEVDPSRGAMFLRLRETDPADPVRNIRVLMPGFTAEEAARNPWHPRFLERWRGVACVRFMDFQETNGSKQERWRDRPRPEEATFTRAGVPVEWLCDLANRLGADAWFCLPHRADDDYVRQFAAVVKARLDPRLKVYLEYSNEVWNSLFAQHRYAAEQGQKLGLAEKPWEAAWRFTARRSLEIFRLWEEVWGGRERLVRVLAGQAANVHVAREILAYDDAARQADALAIAPYLSMNIPARGEGLTAAEVATWSVDRLLDHLEARALPECLQWMARHAELAGAHGLKLVAYEAGQHLVGIGGAENHEPLTRLLHAANAHPRMGDLYTRYFAGWERTGGDLLCHFSSVGAWSKWGSWGLLQYADDEPRQSPKFMAAMRWARKLGQPVHLP